MSIMAQSGRVFFNGDAIASTNYVYSSSNLGSSEEGWTSMKADWVNVAMCVSTLTASKLDYRIEGKFDTYNRAVEILTASVRTAHDIDQLITVSEKLKEIRIGVKVDDASATPNNFYAGICLTERK